MFDRGKQPEYEMDLENRFVAPEVTENDRDNELSLRPHTLEEYIGQEQVKENLSVFMQAARLRGEPLDHVLLYGPPGLGKTTLSQIIAAEMGVNIRITSGPAIEKPGDLAALLTNLNENDILFIDEIHRLNRSVEEVLYPAMEDYALDIIIGKGPSARSIRIDLPRFTLVGATTRAGQLSAPLRDRFGVIAAEALERLEVDYLGLDRIDRRILSTIIQNYAGGPVGLDTLAAAVGEESVTLEDVYEPYLMQIGFLTRTPRGRCVTRLAYNHLHLEAPDGAADAQMTLQC